MLVCIFGLRGIVFALRFRQRISAAQHKPQPDVEVKKFSSLPCALEAALVGADDLRQSEADDEVDERHQGEDGEDLHRGVVAVHEDHAAAHQLLQGHGAHRYDVSLMVVTNCESNAGTMLRRAWGKMMYRYICGAENPWE